MLALRTAKRDPSATALVGIGLLGLLVAIVQARADVHQLYQDADAAVALVLPQMAGHLPHGTIVDLGDHSWYEAWWFMRATAGLPDHLLLWELAPFLVAFIGIGSVAWTAKLALGRRAALYTAVVLLAIGNQMQQVIFVPDARVGMLLHTGLLCTGLLVVWERARHGTLSRRSLILGGLALTVFTAAGATDQLNIYEGVIPFALSACIWWWRNGSRPARTAAVFALLVAAGSVSGAALLSKIMQHHGIVAANAVSSYRFIPTAEIGGSVANFLSTWTSLGNGDFFGAVVNRAAVVTFLLGALTLIALAAVLALVWHSVETWWGARSRARSSPADGARGLFVTFWSAVLLATVSTDILTSIWRAGSPRFLIGGWAAVAALLGALVSGRQGRAVMTAAVASFALVIAVQNIKDGVPSYCCGYPGSSVAQISRYVRAHGALIGYAGYWDAPNFTWLTRFKVDVFPVWSCSFRAGVPSLCTKQFASISSWFTPRPRARSFLISSSPPLGVAGPPASFGPALATATFGPYTVRVYGHDVAAQLLPY